MDQKEKYYQAVLTRDYRFDGQFFVGVKTTGIYCRPICPAKPKRENVEFYSSANAAEKAGFRPCLRCRPESAPFSAAWFGKSAVVQRSLRLIMDQGMTGESEEKFSSRFGVTARHLRRLFVEEIGKTPKQFYQEQRLNLARKMISETQIPIIQVAFASGFGSLRRFNDAFKDRFERAPSDIRKSKALSPRDSDQMHLWLSYRPPFRYDSVLSYLQRHALEGVEEISGTEYIRYFKAKRGWSRVVVANDPKKSALKLSFKNVEPSDLYPTLQKVRRLFDLDADPLLVSTSFEASKILSELDSNDPGGRSPGSWDSFETSICVILGQLVSLKQGRRLCVQLVEQYGEVQEFEGRRLYSFPTPHVLANADLLRLSTTQKRRETIRILSALVDSKEISLTPHQDVKKLKEQLLAIPGIGHWTAEYIGMRCLSDPDSFPSTDLFLKRILKEERHLNLEKVRPWRAYAAHLLWEREMLKQEKNENP